MIVIQGKPVQAGVAVGPIRLYARGGTAPVMYSVLTPGNEWTRFQVAKAQAEEELLQLRAESLDRLGKDMADIFRIQSAILEDPNFLDVVSGHVQQGDSAEYAVSQAGEGAAKMFQNSQNPYLIARAADVRDVSRRLCNILSGQTGAPQPPVGILAANDLTPSEAIGLDTSTLLGLVSWKGSVNSHTAILARAMGIPALTGVPVDPEWDGRMAVLDGAKGCLYINPDDQVLEDALARQRQAIAQRQKLLSESRGPCLTANGLEVNLFANVNSPLEAQRSRVLGCRGIGLMRSEYLFIGRDRRPTEEEQFDAYRQVVLSMEGMPVAIRTLDIGADKQCTCLEQVPETNPALGLRGIRYSLAHPDLFREQLRAILRAAAFGPVGVMFPLVSTLEEVRAAKDLLEQCRQELREERITFGPVSVGTMVETPAAVVMADELAQEVDFLSIGTNDLTQYTLVTDRDNPSLDALWVPRHPAVLRLIRYAVQAGKRRGCRVALCGELGADPELTEEFLRMGIDELSVAPSSLLELREHIKTLTLKK